MNYSSRSVRKSLLALGVLAGMTFLPLVVRPALGQGYLQSNLVSDTAGQATLTDPNLINPWGIVASRTSPFWISDNHSGVSTLYTGGGNIIPLVVTIPPPTGGSGPAAPTGIVFNNSSDFMVSNGVQSGPALFMFATEDGTISGWSPAVDRNNAVLTVDNSSPGGPDGLALGAIYKGLAIGNNGSGNFIYGLLFVTFAMQDSDRHDDVKGPGLGFIDVFDLGGDFLGRFATGGPLNSPWGLALAPADFGPFSGRLLVGNFGDGHINAYRFFLGTTLFRLLVGRFSGWLNTAQGTPITIDGLWGLSFGNGVNAGATNELFFTAGPQAENHGLFGKINFVTAAAAASRSGKLQRSK